jgi:hypothetical protein
MSHHVRILRKAIDPEWAADYADIVRDFFAANDKISGAQSGIPISHFPRVEDFRREIANLKIWPCPLSWLADYCSIRRQRPGEVSRGLPWHQDSAVVLGRTFGWIRGWVLWIPFTPINRRTPGLQIIDSRRPMWHHGNQGTGYLETNNIPRGEPITVDDMELGDVLVFDINCPHRTFITKEMTDTRFSTDLRFTKSVPLSYKGKVIRVSAS